MDRASLIRGAAFALGLLAASVASAQPSAVSWPNVVLKYATDGTPLLYPRVVSASTAAGGGAATLNAAQKLAIGNAVANLQLTRNVPVANLATVLRIASRVAGPLALLGLAYEGIQWLDGQWFTDLPVGDIPVGKTYPSNYPFNCNTGTIGQTAAYQFDSVNIEVRQVVDYTSGSPPAGWQLQESCDWKSPRTATVKKLIAGTCDSLSSAQGFACVEGGEPELATPQQVEQALQQALAASPSLAGQLLDSALQDSEARAALLADAMGITGPATVDGGTTTSTKVDTAGTTTIQTATTYNLSYQGDTVNLTQTKVETITDPANNVTTTTTMTATPTGEPPPPEEQSKFCEEFPDASACQELGEHDPDGELGEEQRALSWSPELSAAGSCPAPITLSIMGSTQSLEWSSVCDLASGVRPVVIALAWLSAAVFVFGVGRVTAS